MSRPIRLMGVVAIVALIVGFTGIGTAWGQGPPATTCRGCNGDVPNIRVGINPNLEIRVGWDRYVLIPGFGDDNPDTIDEAHYALDTLKFIVDFSDFQYPGDTSPAPDVIVEVQWLSDEQGENKAKVTNVTVDKKERLNKRIGARDMKKAILFTRTGLDPTPQEINASSLVDGAEYKFHPRFTLMHTAGNRCSSPDPVNNLPAETDWPNGSEPSEWSRMRSGVVGNIPGHVGRAADYGPKSFTATDGADEFETLTPNLD